MSGVHRRHWRSYGTEPLPPPQQALGEPFRAFPSWFLRIECGRCGKERMLNEAYVPWRDRGRHVSRYARADSRLCTFTQIRRACHNGHTALTTLTRRAVKKGEAKFR